MANNVRIQRDISAYLKSPPEFIPELQFDENNLLKIFFLLKGPPNTSYEGGEYILELDLTKGYPHEAPDIRVLTPSGRFKVGAAICTTFTSFHNHDTWSPSYRFDTIMISFLSFMLDDTEQGHVGFEFGSKEKRMELARKSKDFNREKYPKLFTKT